MSKKVDRFNLNGTTGNVAADMIFAAMAHYRRHNRTVKIVNLDKSHWRIFKSFMRIQAPEIEIPDEGIEFNNVLIRRGSIFQAKILTCELNDIIAADEMIGHVTKENRNTKRVHLINNKN